MISDFLKSDQVNWCFISKTQGHLLDSFEWMSSKLTFGLLYHNLVAFFFYDIDDITGASGQKTAGLQFSTIRAHWHGWSRRKTCGSRKKFEPGCRNLISQNLKLVVCLAKKSILNENLCLRQWKKFFYKTDIENPRQHQMTRCSVKLCKPHILFFSKIQETDQGLWARSVLLEPILGGFCWWFSEHKTIVSLQPSFHLLLMYGRIKKQVSKKVQPGLPV